MVHTDLKRKAISSLLTLALLIGLLPSTISIVRAAPGETVTFTSGAVLLDSSYSGMNVIIENGVFSVTVSGATDVTVIFNGVTIDRRHTDVKSDALDGAQIVDDNGQTMYEVSTALNWSSGTNYVAPTCPFLVTGNSTVTASFRGKCTFYAGTNGCTVSAGNIYEADTDGAGFAGIQVDSGSSLTIAHAEDLTVYGAHQLSDPDSIGDLTDSSYSDALRANADIEFTDTNGVTTTIYDNPNSWVQYQAPAHASVNVTSGGAGIGGGAAYNTTSSSNTGYTSGTPGTIIITSGTIDAYGGHQAAGIGGGVNSAATASKIVINGGNITAHGGRWAAGIGDGDSVAGATSTTYRNESSIEINGGFVTAYGGVASPGIGSSDGLADANITSGMEIAINGGTVNAFSGFPDNFQGGTHGVGGNAPAAIGAGSGSNMVSNSLYISAAATLACAAFGNYSLTEIGTNANTVPTINVDPDSYLLLLRTAQYYSTETRTLDLYEAQHAVHPEFGSDLLIYMDQEIDPHLIYYVDPDTGSVYDSSFHVVPVNNVPDSLTLYVDGNSKLIKSIDLAYYFRSIALTLPDPATSGGIYALNVPTDGIITNVDLPEGEHITLTVEAHTQGTQSGEIKFPSEHNMGKDAVTDPLIDLDVNGNATTDGLIGDKFFPNTYAYTVYVESDATSAELYLKFAATDTDVTHILSLDGVNIYNAKGTNDNVELTHTVDLSAVSQKTVRLKKYDSVSGTLGTISYKITFIKKGDYSLEISDPSKVYDGKPVDVTVTGAYTGGMYDIVDTPASSSAIAPTITGSPATSGSTFYMGNYTSYSTTYYYLNLTTTVNVVKDPSNVNVLYYIVTIGATRNTSGGNLSIIDADGYQMGWTVTYNETTKTTSITQIENRPTGISGVSNNTTWFSSETLVARRSTQYGSSNAYPRAYLYADHTTGTLRIGYMSANNSTPIYSTLFQLGDVDLAISDQSQPGSISRSEAYDQAKQAASFGDTSSVFPYDSTANYQWTQNYQINAITYSGTTNNNNLKSDSFVYSYEKAEKGQFSIVTDPDAVYQPVTLPQADLDGAILTYYKQDGSDFVPLGVGELPTYAGTYKVTAEIHTETYNAAGSRTFTISKREVWVQQIENWLVYKTSAEVTALEVADVITLSIDDPGTITLANVVSGDDLSVTAASVYYDLNNKPIVSFSSEKIVLEGLTLSGTDADNYFINEPQRTFGQIAYDMNGTIFRKTDSGNWRKYYPVDSIDPVDSTTADFHSPLDDKGLYTSHVEYVKARTVNDGSGTASYCVDIEYGSMQFNYYFSIWNVNSLVYDDSNGSYWEGMDGTNNKLTVINYSNRPIYYQMSPEIDFLQSDIDSSGHGITAWITDGTNTISGTAWNGVAAATPGDSSKIGTAASSVRYLMLSGIPQLQETVDYTSVGTINVAFAPNPGGSS